MLATDNRATASADRGEARPVKHGLSRIALACAWLTLALCLIALIGYGLRIPAYYHIAAGFQAMSPLTALGLSTLAAAQLARFHDARTALRNGAALAAMIGLAALMSYVAFGEDRISPWLSSLIFAQTSVSGRTSIATAASILLLGLAALGPVRRHSWASDTAAAIALLIAALALLGYAYGANDLYALPIFRTMAINTATCIFLLAGASILSQAEGGWAHAIALDGAAGRATRRQLLFTLAPPVIGFVLVTQANVGALRLGAAMALFVVLTLAPLIWLILRDGATLAALEDERQARGAAERKHLAVLEKRLAEQATELQIAHAEKLARADRSIQQSETRYRQLFDSIDAGFCVVEMIFDAAGNPKDYRFIEVNTAFEATTGLKNALGQRMRALAPRHEQYWFETYGKVARTGEPIRFELLAAALDDRWYDVHAFRIDDQPPNRIGILFNDISERKRAQLALEEINATLAQRIEAALAEREVAQTALRQSQKMEAMGQLTGGVAHDFNNLLTPIIGSLDLIARRGNNSEREGKLIQGALQSADRAKTLVQRLLAFARRQPLQTTPVDIGHLVQDMAGLATATLGPTIKVVTDVPEGLPDALADANQLEMALLNLSVNARDAMPDGGMLTITVRYETLEQASDIALSAGDYIVLSVADTGIGMDADTRIRATEPFFSTKGIGKGTGLGLSMVHGLAAQLGGALDIHSTPGMGTRVDLWLPALEGRRAPVPALPAASAPEPVAKRRTALVVDDEDMVRMTTSDMLQDIGFAVIETASAREAEACLRERSDEIDVLVTDHLMPGMTGADLARLVREAWPAIPVLLVSGYSDVEAIAPDLPRLSKPFRQADLAKAIAELSA